MKRRITLTIGAAAGGLLAAAFLPAAVAFADNDYTLYAQNPETDISVSGLPPLYQETVGTDVFGAGQGDPVDIYGVFNADVTTLTTSWGFENQEIVDTGGQGGILDVPTGSIFDYTTFGDGFGNEYSDIVSAVVGQNTITDTFITPFGDFNIPTTFDATELLSMPSTFIP
jgi:hypothetical protein